MINAYVYGKMIIQGQHYTEDLILYPGPVVAPWQRHNHHKVNITDIAVILDEQPDYFIIGTGSVGGMQVLPEAQEHLLEQGIQLVFEPTEFAYRLYNHICEKSWVIGAFHLRC